jgi:hypothetical protein
MAKVYKILKGRVLGTDKKYYTDEVPSDVLSKDPKWVKAHIAAGVLDEKKATVKAGK